MNEAFTSTSRIQTFLTRKGAIYNVYSKLALHHTNFSTQPTFQKDKKCLMESIDMFAICMSFLSFVHPFGFVRLEKNSATKTPP